MSFAELAQQAASGVNAALSSPVSIAAYVGAVIGAALVMVSAVVRTMIPLRWLAVGSNCGFVIYGLLHPAPVTLAVALGLLVINIYRAIEMVKLTRRVKRTAATDVSDVWLRPYMRTKKLKAGSTLFARGDLADHLYLLADGEMELVEIGKRLEHGKIFGEIAFFAPDKRRTFSARCLEDCTVLMIDETTVKQLYFQNPAFGFHLVALIAGRLSADLERIRADAATEIARAKAGQAPLV